MCVGPRLSGFVFDKKKISFEPVPGIELPDRRRGLWSLIASLAAAVINSGRERTAPQRGRYFCFSGAQIRHEGAEMRGRAPRRPREGVYHK
jgi:hypothetical protein